MVGHHFVQHLSIFFTSDILPVFAPVSQVATMNNEIRHSMHPAARDDKSAKCPYRINQVAHPNGSSIPIRIPPQVVSMERGEEVSDVKLRQTYDLATWLMYHRITNYRRKSSSDSSGSMLQIEALPFDNEYLPANSRKLLHFRLDSLESRGFLEGPPQQKCCMDDSDEGVFHLEMEI